MRPPVLPVLATLLLAAALPHALRAQDADVPAQGAIQVHPVRHVSAQELENVLRNFLREDLQAQQVARAGQTGTREPLQPAVVVAHAATNSLILSAPPERMQRIQDLIAALDRPAAEDARRIRVVLPEALQAGPGDLPAGARIVVPLHLRHIDANAAQRALVTIQGDQNSDVSAIALDQRTLLLHGLPAGVAEALALVRHADDRPGGDLTTVVVTLEHADAATLLQVLGTLFGQPANVAGQTHTFRCAMAGPKTLVVAGEARLVEEAQELVQKLDGAGGR